MCCNRSLSVANAELCRQRETVIRTLECPLSHLEYKIIVSTSLQERKSWEAKRTEPFSIESNHVPLGQIA